MAVYMTNYVQAPVEDGELRSLVALAEAEEANFFRRNPHLSPLYRRRLIAVALCQGAALQYLRCGYGVKDFDVHFFYRQNPNKPRLSRSVKRLFATVGRFPSIPVDFIRTVVPSQRGGNSRPIEEQIRAFLDTRPTSNAEHLSRKAVIGLSPPKVFGITLWRPETAIEGAAYHRKGFVRLIAVHYGQGDTATPNEDERILKKHLGELCEIVEVTSSSIQLRFHDGELARAVPEEITRDPRAPVQTTRGSANAGKNSRLKKVQKRKRSRRTGRDRLDLGLFQTGRVYRPGSGQTRKVGSHRSTAGHR